MARRSRQIIALLIVVLGICLAAGASVAFLTINAPMSGGTAAEPSKGGRQTRENSESAAEPSLGPSATAPLNFVETAKLVSADPAAAVQMGFSVAVSGDTAIVGAPGEANNRGSAFIFVRNGDSWQLQQQIIGQESTTDDNFGWSVAISGETAVIGAYDLNEIDRGAAYVFVRDGLAWTQQQKLMASDGTAVDQFGSSVSISGDSVVVGASGNNNSRGAAYIFVRSGSIWSQQQELTAADGTAGDEFGMAVGISGETVVIGGPGDEALRGGAYVFDRNGTLWSQTAKLTASDGSAFDRFGSSVGIDGKRIVIGAPSDEVGGMLTGSAYVFSENGGTWQQQKLTAGDGAANDKFGESISISGSSVAIGANGDDIGAKPDQGSVYIFTLSGNDWTLAQKLISSDGLAGDNFGGSVAFRAGAVIVGSYLDDGESLLDPGSTSTFSAPIPMVSISGRVLTAHGIGLKSAVVTIRDAEIGTAQSVNSSTLGYFEFVVESGKDYAITVNSRRYRFSPVPISVNGDISDLQLMGLE